MNTKRSSKAWLPSVRMAAVRHAPAFWLIPFVLALAPAPALGQMCERPACRSDERFVVFGDGREGRRLPAPNEIPRAYGRAELQIVGVKRVGGGPIRVGGAIPVQVFVRNVGGAGATVGLRVIDGSRGVARISYTGSTTINPGKTVSWRIDLAATGSEPSGEAHCGDRTSRLISLVEPPAESVPGYRSGTSEGAAWIPFRDSVGADNERTVYFRFECDVFLEVSSRSTGLRSLR